MTPLLSVVMPTYNGEQYVAAALESIRQQDVHEIELIVVDDGSTDSTTKIVSDFAKTFPIRLIIPGRIGNWVASSNLGLRKATADWVCFLHQDDLWLPDRIARLRPEMEKATGALVLHNAIFVGPDGHNLGRWSCPLPVGIVPPEEFIGHLLVQNFIAIPSPVFRRKAVIESGGLDEALWFTADWDLWLRLGAMGPVRFIDERLTAFRVHPASMTVARKLQPNEWEKQLTAVLDRHLPGWTGKGKLRKEVEGAAMESVAVNCLLAAASRKEPVRPLAALRQFLALGPAGWRRYLRDSRIIERVSSRLKVQRLTARSNAGPGPRDLKKKPMRSLPVFSREEKRVG